jgi:hypothetical protein
MPLYKCTVVSTRASVRLEPTTMATTMFYMTKANNDSFTGEGIFPDKYSPTNTQRRWMKVLGLQQYVAIQYDSLTQLNVQEIVTPTGDGTQIQDIVSASVTAKMGDGSTKIFELKKV